MLLDNEQMFLTGQFSSQYLPCRDFPSILKKRHDQIALKFINYDYNHLKNNNENKFYGKAAAPLNVKSLLQAIIGK